MSEREFLRRCFKKDKAAWGEFVDRYSHLIYNYIHSVFRFRGLNPAGDMVHELFQELFLNLIKDNFQKLRQFKGRNNASLASWLRIVTINFCLDHLKKKQPPSFSLEDELSEEGAALKNIH